MGVLTYAAANVSAFIGKVALLDARECRGLPLFAHGTIRQVVAAANDTFAGDVDKRDGLGFSRLKTHRGPGGYIQPFPVGLRAIETELRIGLNEMVMAAHLHRSIAEVGDGKADGGAAGVEFDLSRLHLPCA